MTAPERPWNGNKWTYSRGVETPVTPARTVLVVEDEAHIRDLVCFHLQLEGLTPVPCADGRAALELASQRAFDLLILDLMLPGLDGVSICRAVRRGTVNRDVPILMLTARREESDKVLGLDSGADDYLAKPFGIRELVARVQALLRRGALSAAATAAAASIPAPPDAGDGARPVRYRHIDIDPSRHRVRVGTRDVSLTAHEFTLLQVLLSHPGIVFSREALLRRTWKEQTYVTVRSVDTLIKRLRRKIEDDPSTPTVILTVWGTGYKAADVD